MYINMLLFICVDRHYDNQYLNNWKHGNEDVEIFVPIAKHCFMMLINICLSETKDR